MDTNFVLALSIVKCQCMGVSLAFRSFSQTATSFCSLSMESTRLARHCLVRMFNSISAISSQLPCFGGIVNLQPPCQTVGLLRLEPLVKRAFGMGVQIIHDDNNCFRFRVHDIANVLDFFCPIKGCASFVYWNVLTPGQWFYYGESLYSMAAHRHRAHLPYGRWNLHPALAECTNKFSCEDAVCFF